MNRYILSLPSCVCMCKHRGCVCVNKKGTLHPKSWGKVTQLATGQVGAFLTCFKHGTLVISSLRKSCSVSLKLMLMQYKAQKKISVLRCL